jgi:hypothetical protein
MLKFFANPATVNVTTTAMTYGITGLTGYYAGKKTSANAGILENHPYINLAASMALLLVGARTLRLIPYSYTFLFAMFVGNTRGNYLEHKQMDFDKQFIRAETRTHALR